MRSDAAQTPMTSALGDLDVRTSPLLRACVQDGRFMVTDYLPDGAYPETRAEKDEVEARVTVALRSLQGSGRRQLIEDLTSYVRHMFPSDDLRDAKEAGQLDRFIAFAAVQRDLHEAVWRMESDSFALPSQDDPVFEACPGLLARIDGRDGLLRLTAGDVDELLTSEGAIVCDGVAVYVHPLLAPARELIHELFELAAWPGVTVGVALHPYRFCAVEDVQYRLLEDYWFGLKIGPENIDSLDRHDTGVRAFHAASQDSVQRFFTPLLGTWFDWDPRSRNDPFDTVKRLYIREVRPSTSRDGSLMVAVRNRELHSERDVAQRRFTHVDGKIAEYASESYAPSAENPTAEPGKFTRARKLWRVDGELTDEQWTELVGLHFRGNELIAEHFVELFPGMAATS